MGMLEILDTDDLMCVNLTTQQRMWKFMVKVYYCGRGLDWSS